MRKVIVTVTLLVLAGAGFSAIRASSARAVGIAPAVADCNEHGRLTHHYSVIALRTALATMPAEIAEYTDCHDVIERQLLVQLGQLRPGKSSGAGGGGGSLIPVWLIVVLAVLVAIAAGLGVLAIRQRRRTPPLH